MSAQLARSTSLTGLSRIGGVLAITGIAVICTAGPAFAHVTANVTTAIKGGYTKITFRVPNEDTTAGTVKLQVDLPTDHPIASVATKPMAGWKTEVTTIALPGNNKAVKEITWTADQGVKIGQGEFQEFDITAGPLPKDVDRLVLPASQTYDSGKVVNWTDQPPATGQQEPEHPAPTIVLQNAATGADSMGMSTEQNAASSVGTTDDTARWLGGAGLAVGGLALGFGVGAALRNRKTGAESS